MGTTARLSTRELVDLLERVFAPRQSERALAVLIDLPDQDAPDTAAWKTRRKLVSGWVTELNASQDSHGFAVDLYAYGNVHANNADLPAGAAQVKPTQLPATADDLDPAHIEPFRRILTSHPLVLAPTEFSTTAPLKVLARKLGFRAATMPGFSPEMVPALRLDYTEISRRVRRLKKHLDVAVAAELKLRVGDEVHPLTLDLRHRTAHASGGVLTQPGTAGNLPSGEAYIVPYEGEIEGDPTGSEGVLPVQMGAEVVLFRVTGNRAVEVLSTGSESTRQAKLLAAEPARGNIAELGLGVLRELGVTPIGEVLLDEKLGPHIAFGRSDHFGGQVGPADFSTAEAVVHIDHVYLPEIQPKVLIESLELVTTDGSRIELMRDGRYTITF